MIALRDRDRINLQEAIIPLRGNPAFHAFLIVASQALDNCVEDLCSDRVCQDERLTMAYIGEIRALREMLSMIEISEPQA